MSSLLREKRKPVDQREILADVVGASFKRSGMEDALAGANPHALIFHRTWIARAGGIDSQSIQADFRKGFIVDMLMGGAFGYGAEKFELFGRISAVGCYSRFLRVEALEARVWITFDL